MFGLVQRHRSIDVALHVSEHDRPIEGRNAYTCGGDAGVRQGAFQPVPALGEVAAGVPEAPEGGG